MCASEKRGEMIGFEFGISPYVLVAGTLMATDHLIAGVAMLSMLGPTIAWLIGKAENFPRLAGVI